MIPPITLILWAGLFVSRAVSVGIYGFDWDEMMMFAMGFAGIAYVIADQKRERRLDGLAVTFAGQLGELKSTETEYRDRIEKLERVIAGGDGDELHAQVQALDRVVNQLAKKRGKKR